MAYVGLTPTQHGHHRGDDPAVDFNGATPEPAFCGQVPLPGGGTEHHRHIFKYDLSGITGAVTQATLDISASNGENYQVKRTTSDWSPSTTVAPGAGDPTLGPDLGMTWTVDVTTLVQAWLAGTYPNYGLWLDIPTALLWGFSSVNTARLDIVYEAGGGGDTTDPVVTITLPADAAEVSGDVDIRASITDNVGVVTAQCTIDGQAQGALTAPNYGALYRWVWDSCPWANGEHTIEVKAWDAAGNMGSDSITIDLQNSLANSTKVLYTDQLTLADSRNADLGIVVLDADDPPVNPAKTYNVDIFCHVPGDTVDLDDYQPLELNRSHGFAAQGNTVKWALRARPLEVLSYWESGEAEIVALCEYPTDLVAVLTDTDPKLLSFDGSALTELLDLTSYSGTPTDVCYVDGKLLIAMGSNVIVYDVDSGQEEFAIDLPGITTVRQIELKGTAEAWIAGDTVGGGRLFAFSYPSVTQVGDVEQILALEAYATAVAIGCAGGKVYVSYGSTPALAYATGETDVLSLHYLDGQMLAGTDANGRIFRSQPAWAQDADLLFSDIAALGEYQSKAYAGGNSAQLWRRDAADTWAQDRTLDSATAINALLGYTDATGAEVLLIGTSGTDARLYRLELSNAGQLQCGVDPPDCCFKLLRTV